MYTLLPFPLHRTEKSGFSNPNPTPTLFSNPFRSMLKSIQHEGIQQFCLKLAPQLKFKKVLNKYF
jgi:hypothetical protein